MPNRNPYVQVTLTYVRRPFSSWFARLASALFLGMFIWFSLADRAGFKDPVFVQLMLFFSLFIALALHMKGQFVDSRARLTPGFRRVHATVAAVATLTAAVVLPAGLSWFMGWHGIGFVAVVMLLFGTILWVIVKDATWTVFAILLGWSAFCSTQSGPAWFRELLSGQIEFQAAAILVLGILITLFAGIRLVRLNAEAMTYDSTLRWDWDWSQKTRQGWTGDGRILPGLETGSAAREMTRLVRLARSFRVLVVADMPMAGGDEREPAALVLGSRHTHRCPGHELVDGDAVTKAGTSRIVPDIPCVDHCACADIIRRCAAETDVQTGGIRVVAAGHAEGLHHTSRSGRGVEPSSAVGNTERRPGALVGTGRPEAASLRAVWGGIDVLGRISIGDVRRGSLDSCAFDQESRATLP